MGRSARLESGFQDRVIKSIEERFPGCIVYKLNKQGYPDLLILYKNKWASLECKRSEKESKQPNQDFYVDLMNTMSFSRFIFPENKEEVLNELQLAFES